MRYAMCLLVLAACGTTDDERPRNLDYITEAILAPSCGEAECHSTFRQADGFVFDTIEGARSTFQHDVELIASSDGDPKNLPGLYLNLTLEQPKKPRMPYTYALPDADTELIKDWLQKGAPGVCTSGTLGCLDHPTDQGVDSYVVHCVDVDFTGANNQRHTEKGAYDMQEVALVFGGGGSLRNCTKEGLRCVKGECK